MKYFWLFLCFFITNSFVAQTKIKGQVIDFDNSVPIAFATITHSNTKITADWEGKFTIDVKETQLPIKINYKGYYEKIVYANKQTTTLTIKLITNLNEKKAKIYSDQTVNNIIKKVIENKKTNDPEKALTSFQYKNYEYLQVTANPDSVSSKIDTVYKKRFLRKTEMKLDSSNYKFKRIVEKQHLYQTEKVNLIQHKGKENKETLIANRIPIYIQISNIIKLQIVTKQLKSGDKLPTVRDLAETAGVNPNTVQRALSDLEVEGFVYSVRTTGRFVTDNVELIQKTRVELAQQELDSFVTNMLDLGFEKIDLVAQLEEFLKGEPYGQTN